MGCFSRWADLVMISILLFFISFLPLHRVHAYSITPRQYSATGGLPEHLQSADGESLLLYWRPSTKSLVQCILYTPNKTIDMFSGSQGNFIQPDELPHENGYCSVTVKTVSFGKDNGTWTLSAKTADKPFKTSTNVIIAAPITIVNRTVDVIEGGTARFTCGKENAVICQVITPKGKTLMFPGPCDITIFDSSIYTHQGEWICTFYMSHYIRPFTASVEIRITKEEFKELALKENEREYAFYCMMPKDKPYIKFCKITTPGGVDLYMEPGKIYGRYTYYGSKPSICGITIPKPLAAQDIGQWRCQLVLSNTGYPREIYGGYTTIGPEKNLKSVQVESKKQFWTQSQIGDRRIHCHVPYIIEYCWIRSPTGSVYIVDENKSPFKYSDNNEGFKFGDCVWVVSGSDLVNSTGVWSCHIGIYRQSVVELQAKVEVIYSDVAIVQNEEEVSGEPSETVHIGCRSGTGIGIKYCRFIRPDGQGISVDETKNNSDYSYYGKGFLYGECGLTIHSLNVHDLGKWSCATKLTSGDGSELSVNLLVTKKKGSLLAVYIVAGVVCLLIFAGATVIIVKKCEFNRSSGDGTELLIENNEIQINQGENVGRFREGINRFVRRRSPRRPPVEPQSSYI